MRRYIMVLIVLLLGVFTLSGVASAQDMADFTYCGDLPDADCELLMASHDAMATLNASGIDLNMNLDVRGIPEMPFEKLVFALNINGAVAMDPELMGMIQDMQANPMQFADPQASLGMVGDLIEGISSDFTITVELPADMVAMAGPEAGMPSTLTFDFRMVDGVGYINLDKIADAMPDAGLPPGWMGADISSLWSQVGEMALSMGDMSTMDTGAMTEYMQSIMDPTVMGEFLTVQRLADSEAMGQTLAVFEYSFDMAAFIQSDAYQQMLQAQMEMAMGGAEVTAEDQAQIDEMMTMMTDSMADLVFVQTTAIGVDDFYIHSMSVHMDWNLDSLINGIDSSMESSGAVVIFDMNMDWSDFNNEVVVEVPEDAVLIPLGNMLPSAENF